MAQSSTDKQESKVDIRKCPHYRGTATDLSVEMVNYIVEQLQKSPELASALAALIAQHAGPASK